MQHRHASNYMDPYPSFQMTHKQPRFTQDNLDKLSEDSRKKIIYTMKHREAIAYVFHKLCDSLLKSSGTIQLGDKLLPESKALVYHIINLAISRHDVDKICLLLAGYDTKTASKMHIKSAKHHIENNLPKSACNYLEAVLDYECAGLTKPDKPRNAYQTINEIVPDGFDKTQLLAICQLLKIDNNTLATDRYDFTCPYTDNELLQLALSDANRFMGCNA